MAPTSTLSPTRARPASAPPIPATPGIGCGRRNGPSTPTTCSTSTRTSRRPETALAAADRQAGAGRAPPPLSPPRKGEGDALTDASVLVASPLAGEGQGGGSLSAPSCPRSSHDAACLRPYPPSIPDPTLSAAFICRS